MLVFDTQTIEFVQGFFDAEFLAMPMEVSVFFEKPAGDGCGAKTFRGTLFETSIGWLEFAAAIYRDGGKVIYLQAKTANACGGLTGAEWEEATPDVQRIAQALREKVALS